MERYTVLVAWKNTVKMTILLNTIDIFKAIPIKTPLAIFIELGQIALTFLWEHKPPQIVKNKFEKEWSWRYNTPWFNVILQSNSNQNNMILSQKQRHRSMNSIESPEIKPHLHGQLIYEKKGQGYTKGQTLQLMVFWKLDSYLQKNQTRLLSHTINKNIKWTKHLGIRAES